MPREKYISVMSEEHTRGSFWRRFLWALLFPRQMQRVTATMPGVVLIALSLGVGLAAYNSASNILFITLSLLLGCLVLSGVLSWFNFRGVHWWLEVDSPMRATREHSATLHVRNTKRLLPTQGLLFEVMSSSATASRELALHDRLDPKNDTQLAWSVRPARRGVERVELTYVASLFPFGFLRKGIAARTACDVVVWPAPIEYRRFPVALWGRAQPGPPVARMGQSGDLFSMRDYRNGDSHRQIHWKASARLGRLVVRQFTAEKVQNVALWLFAPASLWRNETQFDTLCSFAATLAEDLFKTGQLESITLGRDAKHPVRSARDLEFFLDQLSVLKPDEKDDAPASPGGNNLLTFGPEGTRAVSAYFNHEKAATA